MKAWDDAPHPPAPPIGPVGWARVALRGTIMGLITFGGLALLLLLRLIERPIFGLRRPVTPWITQFVCRANLGVMGLRRHVHGAVMQGTGAVVANHVSWLDIFALNASKRIYFVAKSEVAGWPGIGWLARATGTLFIERRPAEAKRQQELFETRLKMTHRLLFFPEGTSTDGRRVLPFKTTLFAAFFSAGLPVDMQVQPVTLIYRAPEGVPETFYGWWGTEGFGAHLLRMLAARRHGAVEVVYHAPLRTADCRDRKAMARLAEETIRQRLSAGLTEAR
ncbi:MAG: lysophospholipid acyltransferase family protein [Pseudomonadota bacterium]